MKCPKCHFDNPDDTRFCGKCGTPLAPSEEIPLSRTETLRVPMRKLTLGSTFAGRYQVFEELGRGGMGKVYKVVDKEIKEMVALKILNPEIAADEDTIERFRNELKLARKVSHKNVCRMHDLRKERGTYYITMEYVSGEDLKSTIRRMGQLSVGKAIFIARQVCEGLAEAHRLGVVHRDLKSKNIMIDRQGNARIMDFGIARSMETKGITEAGMMIGTPDYMSPEQVEGKEADQRSDIYSLGAILYEMVTGKVPFAGDNPISIALKHKTEAPPDPREVNAQIPENFSQVILKCMEKDKGKRYQGAEELLSELSNIEKGIPTTEKVLPERVTLKLNKLFIPALALIALAIFVVIIWKVIPRKEELPLGPPGKPSLAVMYFENNTGDEGLDHWRKALAELLIADLTQSKYLMVLSGDRLFNIIRELNLIEAKSYASEDLKEVAARGRVENILRGSYAKAGDNFRIDVMLQQASTGDLIGSERVEGIGEESIFSMVDELTRRIKENFKLSDEEIAGDIDKQVGQITTSSPEAYKYYSEGGRYFSKGDYRNAIRFYERAIVIDPEFAMAYRVMALAYYNLGYRSEYREYLQKALELSDRVSDRERYRIQADFYYQSEKTYDKAIEVYNKLLQLYPNDRGANNNLGVLYLELEQWDKAIERFEVNILNKVSRVSYTNAAHAYMAKGMYEKAKGVLEDYLNNFSDIAIIHLHLAINHLFQERYDLALVEVDKALSLNPVLYDNFRVKGDIYHCRGDLITAEEEYKKLLELEENVAHLYGRNRLGALYLLQGRFEKSKDQAKQGIELAKKLGETGWKSDYNLQLAYGYLKSGNPEEALEKCEKAWSSAVEEESLDLQRVALHYKGLTYLEMNSIDEAQRVADELKELIQKGMNRKIMRLYHHLMGMIELKRDNFSQAIEYFNEAISLLPSQYGWIEVNDHALLIDSLALAYYQAGDVEKAREEYERTISLTAGRLRYGDIYAMSYYMLGRIYQKKGWVRRAIEHYDKFLNLWKEADPGIPEIIDAKKQLTALQTQ